MNGCNCELSATAAELLRTRLCRALRSVSPSSAKSHICMEHELLVELCSWDHVHHIRTKLGMGSLRFCSRCVFCCAPEEKSKYSANTWYLNCLSAQYYPFLHLAHKLCRGLSSHAAADLFSALFLKACVCECVKAGENETWTDTLQSLESLWFDSLKTKLELLGWPLQLVAANDG